MEAVFESCRLKGEAHAKAYLTPFAGQEMVSMKTYQALIQPGQETKLMIDSNLP
jgi:hypothetical protein